MADVVTAKRAADREYAKRYRRRRRHGIHRRVIEVRATTLESLEERGYLDPDRRGNRADEPKVSRRSSWILCARVGLRQGKLRSQP
jgi:hypothetical protein